MKVTILAPAFNEEDAIDQFVSQTTSKFIVAVLSVLGTAIVLLWMHWQLALFILLLNPLVVFVSLLVCSGSEASAFSSRFHHAFSRDQLHPCVIEQCNPEPFRFGSSLQCREPRDGRIRRK
mgnify:CR=1 FL=1